MLTGLIEPEPEPDKEPSTGPLVGTEMPSILDARLIDCCGGGDWEPTGGAAGEPHEPASLAVPRPLNGGPVPPGNRNLSMSPHEVTTCTVGRRYGPSPNGTLTERS
eukprot:TRINITY_DN378_c0_g1_i16.p2 TRINITY_DN378_c0_g1~~TRINITY_DN378_c0_g1_i16.p2  ORF type:complete len:106 (+),score=4.10 TRINITY_DN378_c0_g1_i16:274-591(+)